MAQQRLQVLGLTRWSYPFQAKGFRQSGGSLEEVRARLYQPQRLEHRLFLLEQVVLPALRQQTNPDFTHLILIGDQLPEPWRSRIVELTQSIPQIIPLFLPEGQKHQDICRSVMLDHIDPKCDATAQYRLDDDDGISVDFVEKTRDIFGELRTFFDANGRLAVDFSKGFILRSTPESIRMEPVSMRFWAPGMAIFQKADSQRALLDFHHLKVWHDMPTFMWSDMPMFIRGAHHDNDSHLASFGRRTRGFRFSHRNPNKYFARRYGIDLEQMQRIWDQRKTQYLNLAIAAE